MSPAVRLLARQLRSFEAHRGQCARPVHRRAPVSTSFESTASASAVTRRRTREMAPRIRSLSVCHTVSRWSCRPAHRARPPAPATASSDAGWSRGRRRVPLSASGSWRELAAPPPAWRREYARPPRSRAQARRKSSSATAAPQQHASSDADQHRQLQADDPRNESVVVTWSSVPRRCDRSRPPPCIGQTVAAARRVAWQLPQSCWALLVRRWLRIRQRVGMCCRALRRGRGRALRPAGRDRPRRQ
jgi:hypothetical protein